MKKKLLTDDSYHSAWLALGVKKLRAMKAAGIKGKRTIAIDELGIDGRQSSDVVLVESTATDNDATDEVKVVQVPPSYYFGYPEQVEMRCWCKGVKLLETAAPPVVSVTVQGISLNDPPVEGMITQKWGVYVGGVLFSEQFGSLDNVGGINHEVNFLNGFGAGFGVSAGIVNGYTGGGGSIPVSITVYPDTSGTAVITPYQYVPVVIEAQAEADAINAAAAAEFGLRSAIVMTDGTELTSVPYNLLPTDGYATTTDTVSRTYAEIRYLSNVLIKQKLYNPYFSGGDSSPYMYSVNVDQTPPSTGPYEFVWSVETNDIADKPIPYDVCFNKKTGLQSFNDLLLNISGISNGEALKAEWIALWDANQIVALERENNRRKKCSHAQQLLLRNGFLPPEFEYFVKTAHPVSTNLRRKIPMEIVSRSETLDSDVTDADDTRTRTYTATVSLRYFVDNVAHTETFTGTVVWVMFTNIPVDPDTSDEFSPLQTETFTYTNLPCLRSGATGEAFPSRSPLIAVPDSNMIRFDTVDPLISDRQLSTNYPLLVIANGVFKRLAESASTWYSTDQYSTPTITLGSYAPPIEPLTDTVVFTHPQYILDYNKASAPIEAKDADGNNINGGPSINWLSSKLTDKEIVRVIPINFSGSIFGEYGMFPYQIVDDDGNQLVDNIKIYGYAEFQYVEATASFTFVNWVEFVEGGKVTIKASDDVEMDDELSPTTLTVTRDNKASTYTLAPRSIEYNIDWGSTNCVCVAKKVIWRDIKTKYKAQKQRLSDSFVPISPDKLTEEESLYKAVIEAIS